MCVGDAARVDRRGADVVVVQAARNLAALEAETDLRERLKLGVWPEVEVPLVRGRRALGQGRRQPEFLDGAQVVLAVALDPDQVRRA